MRIPLQPIRRFWPGPLLALALLVCSSTPGAEAGGSAPAAETTAVVFLARHAETEGDDPVGRWLSAAGRARAEALAD
ncbi:MAG TPA: hypothetical protein VLF66_04230, partial [Thermoanaerobaculia bacterium]|nr:hypothetical protein [Thermoanaerobaculia bacterium]